MKKTFLLIALFIFVFSFSVNFNNNAVAASLTKDTAYQAIVKIKLFTLSGDGFLTNTSYGSGIIIDSSGTVLTNYHVVTEKDDYDQSKKNVAYQICLTVDKNKEPECKYTAKFIASDEDSDMAILKIKNISGLSSDTSYPYLNIAGNQVETNDNLTVLGYPSIGGDTITLTQGVVSGKTNKYNMDWIKTDADISFGNSGGAGVNESGEIIGITSSSYSDMLGSMGYLISINSVNSWINQNKNKTEQASVLESRLMDFAKKENSLNTTNVFSNTFPGFNITKPDDWDFSYEGEDSIYIYDKEDNDGGNIGAYLTKLPFIIKNNDIDALFKLDNIYFLSNLNIIKSEDAVFGDITGKMFTYSTFGIIFKSYYIPHGEYLINLQYDYGKDEKDKSKIESIINSLSLTGFTSNIKNIENYSNNFHNFTFDLTDSGWPALEYESLKTPIRLYNNNDKNALITLIIEKRADDTRGLTNNEIYKNKISEIEDQKSMMASLGISLAIGEATSYSSLGNTNNAISIEIMIEKGGANLMTSVQKYIYLDDVVFGVEFAFTGKKEDYGKYKSEFNNIIKKLSLGNYSQKSIVEEILAYGDAKETGQSLNNNDEVVKEIDQSLNNNDSSDGVVAQKNVSAENNSTQTFDIKNLSMYNNLKGKIMLKVEANGEAYYIHPSTQKMYYLGRPDDAFKVMREQGVGITNENLYKIPIGVAATSETDSDNDGLSDYLERTLGLNANNADTDSDGYKDGIELAGGYSPWGVGKQNLDSKFAKAQFGKILIQVEKAGEAWYVNPTDGKRYFLGRPADAFNVMRNLGLGISNSNFNSIQ